MFPFTVTPPNRCKIEHAIKVIDLGLRLADVEAFGLEDRYEDTHDKGDRTSRHRNLRQNGATEEEAGILLEERIELNALASDELVNFIERKLQQNEIKKIIPSKDTLAEAYELFARGEYIQETIDEALESLDDEDIEVPDDIEMRVNKILAKHPNIRWDDAIRRIVAGSARPSKAGAS
jgi:hypothetical protein